MLTRLHIQGFKNLLDVDVRFGPFTCIAGPNGAGKSNLFDAIRFLHLLTQHPIMEAAQRLRETKGRSPEPRALFTTFEGYIAPQIRFEAELVVDRKVQDDFGVSAEAAISTLKYEVAFRLDEEDGVERLALIKETLKPIAQSEARRAMAFPKKRHFTESCVKGRRVGDFISTTDEEGQPVIRVHQEGHGGRRLVAPKSARTVIGGMASSDYPTVLAAHREMQSWQTLLLEPSAMRGPSLYQDPRTISQQGGNLPAAIFRLQKTESNNGSTYAELANRLSELIEDVQELRVRDDPQTETLTLEIRGRDGVFHPARSLSDGTLRFLVLATLAQDPQARGVLCLEEPENGIHPDRIPAMVRLLKEIAVDTNEKVGVENPLRQVVVNTHSPEVVLNVSPNDDLIYIDEERVFVNGHRGRVAYVGVPPKSWRAENVPPQRHIARGKIRSYLGHPVPTQNRQTWIDFTGGEPDLE